MYMSYFMEDIISFRENRHLFTQNDIKLELNIPKEYQDRVDKLVQLFLEGKIDLDTIMKQFFLMMKKRGYSDNFIKYTLDKIVNNLLSRDHDNDNDNDNDSELSE